MAVREKVIELRTNHPEFTLVKIGRDAGGVSRQRVYQILSDPKVRLPTKGVRILKYPPHSCRNCGCTTNNRVFCSKGCISEFAWGFYLCDFCKNLFSIKHKDYLIRERRQKSVYCSNPCKHLGRKARLS